MSRAEWNDGATPSVNAARVLPKMISDYFSDVRKVLEAKPSPAGLHKIRLASKKIRYTLELFDECYGAEFLKLMEALKDVQTALGDVNDAVSAQRILNGAMAQSARRKALRSYLKRRAAEKAEEFRLHWMERFDADGEERRWLQFLRHPRAATKRRASHA
jgi:CHAD domain-containing protein